MPETHSDIWGRGMTWKAPPWEPRTRAQNRKWEDQHPVAKWESHKLEQQHKEWLILCLGHILKDKLQE